MGWDDLLAKNIVIVLGEPGSGKTWEFREQASLLRRKGKLAFFVRLDSLINESLESVLPPEEAKFFKKWEKSRSKATFFLDSVDEAKFAKPGDFQKALDRFCNCLSETKPNRIQIIVSSRISWQPETDASFVAQKFQLLLENAPKDTAPLRPEQRMLIVQIMPLDRNQVGLFVGNKNHADETSFLEELDRCYAWEMVRRPLDVSLIYNFWKEKNRLGSLTELLEYSVTQNLKETPARHEHDTLSPEKAYSGVQTLAAAAIFCRNFNFHVPDGAHSHILPALDVSSCLGPDWSAKDITNLLSRSIFDSASYGRIRFHHRRVLEFLAAKWLNERLREGYSIAALKTLLFSQIENRLVLRPSLSPIAAWLANGDMSWNHNLRGWILESEPELFFRSGDAAQLPESFKETLLKTFLERYRSRKHLRIETDDLAISKLATSATALTISTIIRDQTAPDDVRALMLELVRKGRLPECLDAALMVIASQEASPRLKSYAAVAIRDVGTTQHRLRLVQLISEMPELPSMLCSTVCEATFPSVIDSATLTAFIGKVNRVRSIGDLPLHLHDLLKRTSTPESAFEILQHFIRLLETPPLVQIHGTSFHISERYMWLRKLIPGLLLISLRKSVLSDAEAKAANSALDFIGTAKSCYLDDDLNDERFTEKLNSATLQHPKLRRLYFWTGIDRLKSEKEKFFFFEVFGYGQALEESDKDWSWLLEDIATRSDAADQQLAFSYLYSLWLRRKMNFSSYLELRRAVPKSFGLLAYYAKGLQFIALGAIYKIRNDLGLTHIGHQFWWHQRYRAVKEIVLGLYDRYLLLKGIRKLRSGEAIRWLWLISEEGSEGDKWTATNWRAVGKRYGYWVAKATRRGCQIAWKQYTPCLLHEKDEPSKVRAEIIIGLSGLQALADDLNGDFSHFSDDEAAVAARYALHEMNGFPSWFRSLAKSHPKVLKKIIAESIDGEWNYPTDRKETHDLMAKLVWDGEGIRGLATEKLLDRLSKNDPINTSMLEQALAILLLERNETIEPLRRIAAIRAPIYAFEETRLIWWLIVWIQIDSGLAITFLERFDVDLETANQTVILLCAALHKDRGFTKLFISDPEYLQLKHVRRLIPLVYRHVRTEQDIGHEGTYSPQPRDEAQHFRGRLLSFFAESDEQFVGDTLKSFLTKNEFSRDKDWIIHLREKNIRLRSESNPWQAEDIFRFQLEHETDPKNDFELFNIVKNRLNDIKLALEKSDNSTRTEITAGQNESLLRSWVARKLGEASRNRYTYPQEAVIDRSERPDIRIENPRTGPVSIEIKWAQNWQLKELIERMENQLAGQYLRAHQSRFGVYLIGCHTGGSHQSWIEAERGKRLDYEEMIAVLKRRAVELVDERKGEIAIEVISLDFRLPKV